MRSRVLVACVSIVALLISGCGKDPEVAKREFLKSGDEYIAAGKLNEAIIQYQNAIQQDPRFGEARFKLAEALAKNGDLRGAIGHYIRAADLMPSNFEAQLKAAAMLILAEKFGDAHARAEAAVALRPQSIEAKVVDATALAGMKQTDRAVSTMEEAIKSDPSRSQSYISLGAILMIASRPKEAEAAYLKAVDVDPTSVAVRTGLASFYQQTGKTSQAEAVLKAALALAPRDADANRQLASVYISQNRAREAEGPLKVVAEVSKDVASRVTLADYYLSSTRPQDAIPVLDALESDPKGFAAAKTRRAVVLWGQGEKANAHAAVDAALAREPKNIEAMLVKADFLAAESKLEEALKMAEAAVAADASAPAPHFAVGRILRTLGRTEGAIAEFNAVLRLNPSSVPAQIELSNAYLRTGRPRDTVQLAQGVLNVQPKNPDALILQARGLMGLGDLSAAQQSTATLMRNYAPAPVIHVQLGDLYRLQGDITDARSSYQRALASDPSNLAALTGLADLDVSAGKGADARARIEAVLAKQPTSTAHLILLGRVETDVRDYAAAEHTFRRVLQLNTNSLPAYGYLGRVYREQDRIDEAIAAFEKVAQHLEKPAPVHALIGSLLEVQGKRDEAVKRYEKALSIDRSSPIAANNLAWILAERGQNLDVALALAQTAKAELPDSAEVADTLGWIYFKKGLFGEAVNVLQEVVVKEPGVAAYHYHLGFSSAKNGDTTVTVKSLETALKLDPKASEAEEARSTLARLAALGS